MPYSITRLLPACLIVLISLGACQKAAEEPGNGIAVHSADKESADKTDIVLDEIPLGQLPAEVQPLAYQLELTIIPEPRNGHSAAIPPLVRVPIAPGAISLSLTISPLTFTQPQPVTGYQRRKQGCARPWCTRQVNCRAALLP